jgi:3-methyladenine DNA glycosylase/8-oxoguanine DNA glycosylase
MVPYYDLGARDTVGLFYLGGRRAEPWEVKEILSRFSPYAGLANWYLIYSRFMGTGLAPQPKGTPNHKPPVRH